MLRNKATELAQHYPNDVNVEVLIDEIQSMRRLTTTLYNESTSLTLLNAVYEKGLHNLYPQICVALRMFTSIPVTVSEGERTFSKLTLVKNSLRSTMHQDRLCSLMVLSCERDLAKTLNYDEIITSFANRKARKIVL